MEIKDKLIIIKGLHSIEWGQHTLSEGESYDERNKSIRNSYEQEGEFNSPASGEVPWSDFNIMILESIRRNHFSKEEITTIYQATQTCVYDTAKAQRKLLFILGGLFIVNIVLLQLGPGLGGNYMKNMDSMLWIAPFGCVMWGFILGTIFSFLPYKGLSYQRKYLLVSTTISIVLNLFILLMAVDVLFK